jgi:hypothetical protein
MIKAMMGAAIVAVAVGIAPADEVVGEIDSGKRMDAGFDQGSRIIALGALHGGSPLGIDFEYGLSYVTGLQFGVGIGGADAGVNLHLSSNRTKDAYLSARAIYLPAFDHLVMPAACFGFRRFFGFAAGIGLSLELGTAVAFREITKEFYGYSLTIGTNGFVPLAALGAVFKLRP